MKFVSYFFYIILENVSARYLHTEENAVQVR